MQSLLKEGYLEIAQEARRIAEEFKRLDKESLKYVDSRLGHDAMTRKST